MTLRIPVSVVVALVVGFLGGRFQAQDVPLQGSNAVVPVASQSSSVLPSSFRPNPPQYADDPGVEQQFSIAPDRVFSFCDGAWGWSPRFALPARSTRPSQTK